MRLHQVFLLSLAFALGGKAASSDEDFELRQLTSDNFKSQTAQGLWLVEHFSPKCSHCRAFAPTWTQIAKDKQHLERLSGFHMAQVNCLAQGDLCNTNGIKFYPQLVLYTNGVAGPNYSGDRSYADLTKYIDEQSDLFARGQLLDSNEEKEVVLSGFGRPNAEGKVLEVDEAAVEVMKGNGPVLVDFYAPWCGHCKKLRPTYEKVADSLKNKLNVVAVDCDAHRTFCRAQKVNGYPTIRLFHHDTFTEYTGARTVDKMKAFALKHADAQALQPIKLEDFDEILEEEDAFFLYLQNFDTSVTDLNAVKSTLDSLTGTIASFTSADPLLYRNLSIANPPPTSVLLAFSAHSRFPVGSLAFPANSDQLHRFVKTHKYPTLVQLTSSNYNQIMKSEERAAVVLAAVHGGDTGAKERAALEQVARAWKRGGRGFQQPVFFVWVDGERWSAWLRQSYGIKKKDFPAVIVADPSKSEYYDTTIEGNKMAFEGSAIFSVLEGFYQHFLRPKRSETTLEWGSRSATMTLINISHLGADHPFWALLTVVGGVAVFVFLLQKCIPRDAREVKDGDRLD